LLAKGAPFGLGSKDDELNPLLALELASSSGTGSYSSLVTLILRVEGREKFFTTASEVAQMQSSLRRAERWMSEAISPSRNEGL
jgi:hypothetical protein